RPSAPSPPARAARTRPRRRRAPAARRGKAWLPQATPAATGKGRARGNGSSVIRIFLLLFVSRREQPSKAGARCELDREAEQFCRSPPQNIGLLLVGERTRRENVVHRLHLPGIRVVAAYHDLAAAYL